MDLISAALKNEANQAMADIFDTFKRNELIKFYKPAAETAIVESPNYIARLQQYTNYDNVTYVPQSVELEARIIYPKREGTTAGFIKNNDLQVKAEQELGITRIQIKPEDLSHLIEVERFILFEEEYQRISTPRRIGIFGTINVISFDLKRVGNHFSTQN